MIRFLLDSDCVVYATGGLFPALAGHLQKYEPGEIGISSISFAEVMLGSIAGKPPAIDVLDDFVRVISVVPFDEAAARAYAAMPFRRARFDRLIAAHALSLNATLVTNNEMDFAEIPDLLIENWTR